MFSTLEDRDGVHYCNLSPKNLYKILKNNIYMKFEFELIFERIYIKISSKFINKIVVKHHFQNYKF
jgi:(2Fe-2S) ferredoxin